MEPKQVKKPVMKDDVIYPKKDKPDNFLTVKFRYVGTDPQHRDKIYASYVNPIIAAIYRSQMKGDHQKRKATNKQIISVE